MAFKYMTGNINTKLFVGGLNYNTSEQKLSEFFGKFGNVVECVVMKFPDSGESRGFGFVTFSTEQEVEWCLSSLPLSLDGKNIDVKRAEAPTRDGTKVGGGVRDGIKRKGGDANCKVFVGGLNYNTQEDMLKQVFSRYGKVNDWIIMKFPDSGESRGFGFVTFSSAEEVERCLINQPVIVDGKSVDIKKAEPPSARAPNNSKQTKQMSRFKYQKEKESCIDNKLPRGGGTMADICSGGNQCGGGFGNNCGHDTFSSIASQVVAMTTNHSNQEPVDVPQPQDHSKYYQEYSKWYAAWRQYNEYMQGSSSSGSAAPPPLPPGERPKTPPQPQNKASIRKEPQYSQDYLAGGGEGQSSQQWAGHHQTAQTADQYNQHQANPHQTADHYNKHQANPHQTADQYKQYHANPHQTAQTGDQYNQAHPNHQQQRKRRSDTPPSWVPHFNQSGGQSNNDISSYNNDGRNHSNDGRSYNKNGRNYNNDRRYNDDVSSYNNDGSSYSNDGEGYVNLNGLESSGVVEPERNEFYQHNLEIQKRKRMRMSS